MPGLGHGPRALITGPTERPAPLRKRNPRRCGQPVQPTSGCGLGSACRAALPAQLPAGGLLIWHVDESQETNEDENHYLVALLQADGSRDLENDWNRGDGGDPYPGWSGNTALTSRTSHSIR